MNAEITMSQMYWNPSILGFFFTKQAQNTLTKLLDKAEDKETALEQIDDHADSWDMDADAIGDMFHDMTVEELAAEFEIDLTEDEDEEAEEEDWRDHAHEVLDENFPEEDELVKDDFCCEHWQNGLPDEDNIANFKKYVKSIAEE